MLSIDFGSFCRSCTMYIVQEKCIYMRTRMRDHGTRGYTNSKTTCSSYNRLVLLLHYVLYYVYKLKLRVMLP